MAAPVPAAVSSNCRPPSAAQRGATAAASTGVTARAMVAASSVCSLMSPAIVLAPRPSGGRAFPRWSANRFSDSVQPVLRLPRDGDVRRQGGEQVKALLLDDRDLDGQ